MIRFAVFSFLAVVPKVEVTPKTVTEMQGSNVKAVCSASGSPPPEILWNLDLLSTHHEVSWSTIHSFLFKPLVQIHFGLLVFFSCSRSGVENMRHLVKRDVCG